MNKKMLAFIFVILASTFAICAMLSELPDYSGIVGQPVPEKFIKLADFNYEDKGEKLNIGELAVVVRTGEPRYTYGIKMGAGQVVLGVTDTGKELTKHLKIGGTGKLPNAPIFTGEKITDPVEKEKVMKIINYWLNK